MQLARLPPPDDAVAAQALLDGEGDGARRYEHAGDDDDHEDPRHLPAAV